MATSEHDLKAPLVQRLRFRAELESPDRDFDWETSDAIPEVSWPEMLEIVALLREAAEALERLSPERAQDTGEAKSRAAVANGDEPSSPTFSDPQRARIRELMLKAGRARCYHMEEVDRLLAQEVQL